MEFTPSYVADTAIDQMFTALDGMLDKAAAHAKSANVDESVYTNWRLAPDMFNMARQVGIACGLAVRGMARLARVDPPSFEDKESTIGELKTRIAASRDMLRKYDRAAINADPEGEVSFPVGPETMTMKRRDYLMKFILPNVYFHTTAAYLNFRNAGVPLGKNDFLARGK